jgi:MYXO-CTERM domain-containing protein
VISAILSFGYIYDELDVPRQSDGCASTVTSPDPQPPTHPKLAAALLMLGISAVLVLLAISSL